MTIAAAALAAVLVVAAVAFKEPTGGTLTVIVALLLAPIAVGTVAFAATKVAGRTAGAAAAVVYVLLPVLANRMMLGTYRSTFDRHSLPGLVGLHEPLILAVGIAAVATAAASPRLAAAGAGLVLAVVALALWGGTLGKLPPAFHETIWSVTFAEWLVVAGMLGVLLRSPARGVAYGGIAIAAISFAAHRGYDGGAFWAALAGTAPVAAVLLTSLGSLVPRRRPAPRKQALPEH